jgi:bifunctional non-homologous end joining protein LigD
MSKVKVGLHTIEISNENKVLFPGQKITKGDLIAYYHEIAKRMLPYLEDRPVVMHRFPDGVSKQGFYEKRVPDHFPKWISRVTVKKEGGEITHGVCNDAATLVYLANQACITPHVWLSKKDKLDYPDQMIFDLDPSGDDFGMVRQTAVSLRKLLKQVGLIAFVKTSGARGLHVHVPLNRNANFDTVRSFARDVANALAERDPKHLTTEQRKNKRRGRVFLDTNRNAYGQTAAPPYSIRPKEGAPVATPLDWNELKDSKLKPQTYTIRNIFKRLSQKDDPWSDFSRHAASLNSARKKLDRLLSE